MKGLDYLSTGGLENCRRGSKMCFFRAGLQGRTYIPPFNVSAPRVMMMTNDGGNDIFSLSLSSFTSLSS